MYQYPYPYDQTNWTVNDQKYWCNMVNKYRYPIANVREPFRYIIENQKCNTFEAEYNEYLATV